MTEVAVGNLAGIVFFAICTIGVIIAVMRKRARLKKGGNVPTKAYDLDGTKETEISNLDKLLDDQKDENDSSKD